MLKPTERAQVFVKNGTREFQNNSPFERAACFYATISGKFEHSQYFNFETDFWKTAAFRCQKDDQEWNNVSFKKNLKISKTKKKNKEVKNHHMTFVFPVQKTSVLADNKYIIISKYITV